MSLYEQFQMSRDLEVEGIMINYGSGGRFRIARAGGSNKRYQKRMDLFYKRHKREIDLEILEDDDVRKELVEVYADTIILGWESGDLEKPDVGIIPGPDGKPLKFCRENVIKILVELPDLFDDIRVQASKMTLFREALKQQDAGNS